MQIVANVDEQGKCTAEIIEWLHQVFEMGENGRTVAPDPFYDRTSLLTDDIIDNVIGSIEGLFVNELEKFPGYHYRAQGASSSEHLVPPGFDKMSRQEKLAVVQGIDKICCKYRAPQEIL